MKALLSLTVVAGLLISSTSSAFCLKQFSKQQQTRTSASLARTIFHPNKAVANSDVVSAQAARK